MAYIKREYCAQPIDSGVNLVIEVHDVPTPAHVNVTTIKGGAIDSLAAVE